MITNSSSLHGIRVNQLQSARLSRMSKCFLLACLPLLPAMQVDAAEIQKANNALTLNLTTSWVGGVVPGASDIALFDSTVTASKSAAIGGNLSWAGIKVTDAVGIQAITTTAGSILTLGSSGIDMSSATGATLTVSANMDLTASQTWNVATGRSLTVGGGAGGVNTGNGTITLSGGGNFIFGTSSVLSSGVVTSGPLGIGTVNLENGIHLFSGTTASRTFYNVVNLNGNIEVTMTGASSSAFSFSGGLNIGSGTRTISIVNSNGSATNTTLGFGGGVGGTYSQVTGSGVLVLENGNAADTPIVSVRIGNNVLTSDYAVISADLTIGSGVTVAAAINNVLTLDSDVTVNSGGYLNLSNNSGSSTAQTIGSLSGSGTVYDAATSAGTSTLAIDGGARTTRTTFSGVVQNGTVGIMSVTKSGSTTQEFSGANNYTGATTINGGTLIINGTHIQSVAGNGYTVNSGGTLGGSGRLSMNTISNTRNAVLVNSGGTLAPGDGGTGTLTLDGVNMSGLNTRVLNMASGAKFSFDLAGDGSSADQVAFWNYVTGDMLLNPSGGNAINLSITGTLVEGTYTVSIFKFYSNDGTTLTTSGITSGLTIGTLDSHIQGTPTLTYNSAGERSISPTPWCRSLPPGRWPRWVSPRSWCCVVGRPVKGPPWPRQASATAIINHAGSPSLLKQSVSLRGFGIAPRSGVVCPARSKFVFDFL